ncbi:endonuclease domain-containing protein [Adlercreutzia sp. ZJ138]|uniref:endonuclease domain-containing protein n=1 Tax=Adlercreutzia sp. ZJ138 TaxID=2709405 RepID=UPI002106CDCA|nr:DUF559 domain-containing protein [Adlercreutzia sp. ZJ138]
MLNFVLPEARIEDIVDNCDPAYSEQCVDFYCPRASLVLEVDGSQHETSGQSYLDRNRDLYLEANGVTTIRITTDKLDASKAAQMLYERFDKGEDAPSDFDEKTAFVYEIAIRLQMALLSLIKQGALTPDNQKWAIDFICDQPEIDEEKLVREATNDLFDLFENLCVLADRSFKRPTICLSHKTADVKLDVSATKMWSEIESEKGTVYVRNDYYETMDHFFVSDANPIVYGNTD